MIGNSEEGEGITLARMCAIIAESRILKRKDGSCPTEQEIFNYSPRGELAMIWEWYLPARDILEEIRNLCLCYGALNDNDPCMYCGKPSELWDNYPEICKEHKRLIESGTLPTYPVIKIVPLSELTIEEIEATGIEVLKKRKKKNR